MGDASDDILARLLKTVPPLELLRIVQMPEAEHLSGLSEDSIERHHSEKVVRLSPRRKGMRVIDALMLRESSINA
jgi:hypothetical protein